MTNEEKALKISEELSEGREFECSSLDIYDGAMQMAQWKDEQFSKFLLWLDDNYDIRRFTDGKPMTYAELIDNFKSMEQ